MQDINIIYLPIDDLKPYEYNARKHDDEDIDTIVRSIEEFGFNDPIGIWSDENIIVEGHGRYLAAQKIGMEKVPCIRLDHLTDEQRRAYALAHNRTAELSGWDTRLVKFEIDKINEIDMTALGFGDDDDKEPKEKPEVPFTEVLGEENNYLILQFKNDIDWLQAVSVFGLGSVKAYSTRKDGKVTRKMQRIGTARVLDGAKALRDILGE